MVAVLVEPTVVVLGVVAGFEDPEDPLEQAQVRSRGRMARMIRLFMAISQRIIEVFRKLGSRSSPKGRMFGQKNLSRILRRFFRGGSFGA